MLVRNMLLGLGLGIPQRITWATALQSEHLLRRILWIAENTLNPQLIEKSSGLLLAIVENEPEVVAMFLPTLKNLGLMYILVNLLSFELSKLSERLPERYRALESFLRVIEVVSTTNEYSQEISFNLELFRMAVELDQLPDKLEAASSCITAAVLIATVLTDSTHLALELSKDPMVLQCLFDLFPLTSDDFEARNAIWSIVSRILVQVKEDDMSPSHLASYVLALVSNSDLIEDDLLDYPLETSSQEEDSSNDGTGKLNFREIAPKQILSLLDQWIMMKDRDSISSGRNHVADGDVQKLSNRWAEAAVWMVLHRGLWLRISGLELVLRWIRTVVIVISEACSCDLYNIAEILTGDKKGNLVLIPRITLTPSTIEIPFKMSRRQFPVRLAFAMTINKS